MRLGIGLPVSTLDVTGELLVEWMSRLDKSPFTTAAVIDEVVAETYEGMSVLAAAAAITRRPRLMSTIVVGPLRNTALLAKQALSVDALSGGRLALGLGVGFEERDFAAIGVDLKGRGRRFDEQLATMKSIWAGEPVNDTGDRVGPSPVRPGGPELLIGGWAPKAIARVGRFADGYIDAVLDEEMISDTNYRIAEQSWRENQRPGKPHFVQNVYFALGPEAGAHVEDFVQRSYSTWPEAMAGILEVTPTTEKDLRNIIKRISDTGVDELICHPVSAQIDQFERLEQALH